ncbi:SRPBCC family protein [Curtobacterium sp. Leaf261]|uniref:SRPBCC family protein n=1 Tax=Curtobacterium sp. Leaf261 TaxID=1736311 RepID=UPI0006F3F7C7|nr:SRPBCC family protein [Curtobacterium sp. Leaf261]KQO64988.1 polyketide cyclase [Curtobacterium sp. Leaf261]
MQFVRRRVVKTPPETVFAVLAEGWLFPSWVVGASRMRGVEGDWPAVDSRIHHSFGVWPFVVDDTTSVTEWDPPRRAVFTPRGWPLGEARVVIDVEPHRRGCLVRMEERAVKGPGTLLPDVVMSALVQVRNGEALRRLGWLAEGGAAD